MNPELEEIDSYNELLKAQIARLLGGLEDKPTYGPFLPGEWVPDHRNPEIQHLQGVVWLDAPIPPRLHRCTAQTKGFTATTYIERCACGAIRGFGSSRWSERNERRHSDLRKRITRAVLP